MKTSAIIKFSTSKVDFFFYHHKNSLSDFNFNILTYYFFRINVSSVFINFGGKKMNKKENILFLILLFKTHLQLNL